MKRLKSYSLSTGLKYSYILLILTALISLTIALVTNLTNQDLITPTQAAPTTFTVDSTADTGDATPGDDICDTGGGICTLRAAIEEANGDADLDTIQFGIPNTDGNHLCYADDSVANQVTPANEEVTTAQDACSSGSTIDPDHPYTWFRFSPASQLGLTQPAHIYGYTQTGASANTVSAPGNTDAILKIEVEASAQTVGSGLLAVNGISGTAFEISGLNLRLDTAGNAVYALYVISTDMLTASGNYIGTDISGLIDGNSLVNGQGIYATSSSNNTFGGNTAADRNVISGNVFGIYLRINNTNNTVSGNFIGVDKFGTSVIGGQQYGLLVYEGSDGNTIGGPTVDERNIIAGNTTDGISIDWVTGADSNHVMNNYIGTDVTGSVDLGNGRYGVYVNAGSTGNIIGTNGDGTDDANEGNVISGNGSRGILVANASNNTEIAGNIIGLDATGTSVLANDVNGIEIQSASTGVTIGTDGDGTSDVEERNIISGNTGDGVYVHGAGTDNNVVAGNYIGTDINGTADLGNTIVGIRIGNTGSNNTIGTNGDGTNDGSEGNVVSGNDAHGIYLSAAPNNTIAGNYIGTDVNGTADLGNTLDGVRLDASSNTNIIGTNGDGTADTDERNIISANDQYGIYLVNTSNTNTIAGNYIGTDVNGTADLGNSDIGVFISTGSSNIIGTNGDGTADTEERNVISGNDTQGVYLNASNNNTVAGNYIGTNAAGTADLGNTTDGVIVANTSANNTIGTDGDGTADTAERNVISGNDLHGVQINTANTNTVAGNYIGTDVNGTADLGNSLSSVYIVVNSTNNIIGTDGDGTADTAERNLLSGNGQYGVVVSNSDSNTVAGNYIGTDVNGTADLGNTLRGVYILSGSTGNTVGTNGDGTADTDERNIISGNDREGVYVDGAGTDNNTVAGNYIGTDVTGTADLGNTFSGVSVIFGAANNTVGTNGDGTADTDERNIISGNDLQGVVIHSAGTDNNTVAGNYIGTDVNGTADLGNTVDGISIESSAASNTIGTDGDGTADTAERNLISGNNALGIEIDGAGSDSNTVAGNYIGTNAAGTAAIANDRGVRINSSAANNIIGTNGDGTGDAVEGNLVSGNTFQGIQVNSGSTSNVVAGNTVGTDVTGAADLGNGYSGVSVWMSDSNRIGTNGDGTSDTEERNLVSGNDRDGVSVTAADSNIVAGNYIGTDASGTAAISNTFNGVIVGSAATNTVVGTNGDGTGDSVEGNVISGNTEHGVHITDAGTDNNTVAGNYIGTDVTGTVDLGNATHGVHLALSAASNTIGTDGDGTADVAERNVVSGNDNRGISAEDSDNNVIAGNYVGVDSVGTADLGNTGNGIQLLGGSTGNRIGTDSNGTGDTEERNVIAGNDTIGVVINGTGSDSNTVAGNYIGADATGTAGLANNYGIALANVVTDNMIGGLAITDANLIAYNTNSGVSVNSVNTDNNAILGNTIHSNAGLGIDHYDNNPLAPDANDHLDTDSGSNDGLNYPVVLNNNPSHPSYPIATTNPSIDVYLDVDVTETTNFLVQLYDNPSGLDPSGHGEGEVFVANANVTAAAGGVTTTLNFTGNISDPANIALTITEDLGGGNYGSTSEFSSPYDQYLQGRVFNDLFNDNDDDSEPTDLGYNAVTLDIYADDGDDTFDNLTDRLVDSLSTSNNQAGGSEDGEYSSLLSTGGDYWVEVTDTGTVIPVAVSPSGPDREAAQVNTTGDWTVAFAGTTNASFGYGEDLPDADNDNIPTAEEDAGPNAGDANGDSVLDSKQSHVASSQNENTQNHYNVLQLNPAATTCTQIDNFDFTTEADLTTQDEDYDYPLGLVDFTISCTNPGDQAAVTYILDQQYDTSDWQWRKYNSTTNEYQDITDQVVFGEVTIDGTTKTTVSYNLQDGSSLDEDNLANGTIIDPAGAALPAEDLSETGARGYIAPVLGLSLVTLTSAVGMRARRRVVRL